MTNTDKTLKQLKAEMDAAEAACEAFIAAACADYNAAYAAYHKALEAQENSND